MGVLVISWIVMGALCAVIALAKGRSAIGWFVLGCLLGPLALLFAAVMSAAPKNQGEPAHPLKKCPYCAEQIQLQAVACKHCGKSIGGIVDNHPMKGQWNSELEKLAPRKSSRWGSSPDSTNENGS